MYFPVTHNTPYFEKAGQFEGGGSVSFSGVNANVAFTPVKYLALQYNFGTFPERCCHPNFQNYAEYAAGFYLPLNNIVIGVNGGYGEGAANWNITTIGHSGYTMNQTKFDSQKYFGQLYLAFKKGDGAIYRAISVKINRFENTYAYMRTDAGDLSPGTVKSFNSQRPIVVEINYNYKRKLINNVFFTLGIGLAAGREVVGAPGSSIIVRPGLALKF